MCTGHYHYDRGYTPAFEGWEPFTGEIVRPQRRSDADGSLSGTLRLSDRRRNVKGD